jgi:RimJ/RimL family protein N-acetyltransferase
MNLEFRKIQKEDIPFVNTIRNEYAEEFLHDSRRFTMEESYEWFEKTNPNYYIIFDNKKKIGYFRLSNYSEINKNIYVGADISPEYRGRGYGYHSYKVFIPYLFDFYKLNKITLEVLSTNEIAKSLYLKIGFKYEGCKRKEVNKNGVWIDSIIMSILKDEYIK